MKYIYTIDITVSKEKRLFQDIENNKQYLLGYENNGFTQLYIYDYGDCGYYLMMDKGDKAIVEMINGQVVYKGSYVMGNLHNDGKHDGQIGFQNPNNSSCGNSDIFSAARYSKFVYNNSGGYYTFNIMSKDGTYAEYDVYGKTYSDEAVFSPEYVVCNFCLK